MPLLLLLTKSYGIVHASIGGLLRTAGVPVTSLSRASHSMQSFAESILVWSDQEPRATLGPGRLVVYGVSCGLLLASSQRVI
jgi:hypothetical protein